MKWYLYPYYFSNDLWLVVRNRLLSRLFVNPPKKWKVGDKGNIILIPGANARWVSLKKIGSAINKKGYRIHTIKEFGNNSKSTIDGTKDVARYIKDNNLKNVILIGHSKGGIIAISLLKDPAIEKRVKKIINIAVPLKGTLLSISPSTRELQPSSELIKHYGEGINMKKVISIYPKIDDMVIPNENLIGKDYTNIRVNVFGHIRIVESEEAINKIKSILASLN